MPGLEHQGTAVSECPAFCSRAGSHFPLQSSNDLHKLCGQGWLSKLPVSTVTISGGRLCTTDLDFLLDSSSWPSL